MVAFDEVVVTDSDALVAWVSATAPGTRTTVRFFRDGQERTEAVTVEELLVNSERTPPRIAEASTDFGLALEDITPTLAAHLRLSPGVSGALVVQVAGDSPGERAGLNAGDIIMTVNRRAVHSAAEARREFARAGSREPVFVLLWRGRD